MSKENTVILIDGRRYHKGMDELLAKSGFWKKIRSFSFTCAVLGDISNFKDSLCHVFASPASFFKYAESHSIEKVVFIEIEQIFLDVNIVKKALADKSYADADYFTQYEHTRLPIGVGARVFAMKAFKMFLTNENPEVWTGVFRKLNVKYDGKTYSELKFAMYDSRLSKTSAPLVRNELKLTFDLEGFLRLAEKYGNALLYKEHRTGKYTLDERKMPAVYGFESSHCAEFPSYIMFDITNVCNSRCVHCPHSVKYSMSGARAVFLDMDIYKKVIDECAVRKIDLIRLTADGEPLLHKGLVDMVKYASEKGIKTVGLTTNGSLMTRDIASRLMDAGLFMVDFSLDAAKNSTYSRIRQGMDFFKVVKNIEDFLSLKKKKKSRVKVMVSFVKQKDNEGEEKEFMRLWEKKVDKVLIREIISNVNLIKVKNADKVVRRWPCPHFFRRIVINYDGIIKACPVDWENKTLFMSIKDTSIYDAWHSGFYAKNRLEHLNNSFVKKSACGDCGDWQGSPWRLGYEKVVKNLKINKTED